MGIIQYAYDPQKTSIIFDGNRISGFAADVKYTKGETGESHILHLQVTSKSLPDLEVGRVGVLVLNVHRGGDEFVSVNLGKAVVKGYSIDRLENEVPVVRVLIRTDRA